MYPELIVHYVPLTLLTLASFSSFSMEANRGNDRIGFLITLFLVMVSMAAGVTARTPGANQITLIGGLASHMGADFLPAAVGPQVY